MSTQPRARYIMIGGFLGAGKTTAVVRLAQHLTARGQCVGLITNDQGSELVDTAMLRARGFATEEIPGGCFCCRFNSLTEVAERLTAAARPDVFIADEDVDVLSNLALFGRHAVPETRVDLPQRLERLAHRRW